MKLKIEKKIDPKTGKWQRYYRIGKCVICYKTEVEVSRNFQQSWCCASCRAEMEINGRKRATEANLFGR